jgi:hypothetical protein
MLYATEDGKIKILLNFTFMLPCIVIDFFLNNKPDALIIPNLFYHKNLHVSCIISAIIRNFLLHIRHWQVSCSFLMTASKRSQDGNASSIRVTASSADCRLCYQCRMYSRKLLMTGREDAQNM